MTIVFFFPVILRDVHRKIYGMEKLEEEGNEIIILDATQYYNVYGSTATDPYIFDRLIRCKKKSDFINFKNSLENTPIIFVTDNLYMQMAFQMLNTIIRKQDRILVCSTRFTSGHYNYPQGLQKFFSKVLRQLDIYFPLHIFKLYYKHIRKTYVPDYYLGATKFLTANNTILSVKKKNRIYVHSDDINFSFEPMKNVYDSAKKVGVFIDQMLPYFNGRNPDLSDKEVNKEYKLGYYKNLVKTFKKIQKELELDDIVIALHPEAETLRKEIDEKFSPFKTYIGLSNELIKDSTIVLGHFSTVLGMAVYYQKPIVLLTDQNMLNRRDRKRHINSYSEELGLKKLQIDQEKVALTKNLLEKDDNLYSRYIKKFLKETSYEGNSFYYAVNKIKADLMA